MRQHRRKLRTAWADVYELVLIDKEVTDDDSDVIEADLAVLDDDWITHFHGVDTVVHLAANGNEFAPWDELIGPQSRHFGQCVSCGSAGGGRAGHLRQLESRHGRVSASR